MSGYTDVVIGTGPLGRAVINELQTRGREVRAVNRSGTGNMPADVHLESADLSDPEAARRVLTGAERIFFCAQPPYEQWAMLFPPLIEGVIAGVSAVKATLIYAGNLYVYGKQTNPFSEEMPFRVTGPKGGARVQVEERLLEAHALGEIEVAIGRASDFYGPRVIQSSVGEQIFGAAVRGKTANVLGDPDLPHTYTYIRDFARGLVTLADHEEALGEVWHIPSAPTITTREFVELINDQVDNPVKIRSASGFMVSFLGLFNRDLRALKEIFYQYEQPFVMDHSKFERTFDTRTTPHREAIAETVRWYQEQWLK